MRKFLLMFAVLTVSSMFCSAQYPCEFYYGHYKEGGSVTLYGDKVNVRSAASTTASVVANLPIGTEVEVIGKTEETFSMSGYSTNWYNVSFTSQNEKKTGYIWGGLMSMATADLPTETDKTDLFVCSVSSWVEGKGFMATARVIRDGKIFTSLEFEPISFGFFDPGYFGHSVCVQVDDSHGFKGIRNVIRVEFSYEACGYSNGEVYLLWDGTKLIDLTSARWVVDAGVFAYTVETYFPDDSIGGHKDTLTLVHTFIETYFPDPDVDTVYDDDGRLVLPAGGYMYDESGEIIKKEITMNQFVWDGIKVTELPEITLPLTSQP